MRTGVRERLHELVVLTKNLLLTFPCFCIPLLLFHEWLKWLQSLRDNFFNHRTNGSRVEPTTTTDCRHVITTLLRDIQERIDGANRVLLPLHHQVQRSAVILHREAVLLCNCIRILEPVKARLQRGVFGSRSFNVRVELMKDGSPISLLGEKPSLRIVDIAVCIGKEEVSV